MNRDKQKAGELLWAGHNSEWREPGAVASGWKEAGSINPRSLQCKVKGKFWEILGEHAITLLVSREYEHFLLGLSIRKEKPLQTYFGLPHPSGICVDRKSGTVFTASTRNPNQLFSFLPANSFLSRAELGKSAIEHRALFPVRTDFYPGCLYLHDIACIDGKLLGTSAGQNAVISLHGSGRFEPRWWPKCIEVRGRPRLDKNYLQLNSIAAGKTIADSYFCASCDELSSRRPGHRNFPVDGRGVVFSGKSREVVAGGLTRPHSIRRFHGKLWINNSGYGEAGLICGDRFEPIIRLPGWTRGLAFSRNVAFVGVSRVIPRFKQYAPGLKTVAGECGIYAVEIESGEVLGSIVWPQGNQIFAIEAVESRFAEGYPFIVGRRSEQAVKRSFYSFVTRSNRGRRS